MLLDQLRPARPRLALPVPAPAKTAARRQLPLLTALHDLAQGHAELVSHVERSWASATFAGTRHTVTFAFNQADGMAAGEDFIALLPEHEFAIPGQLVADAAITAVDHQLLPDPIIMVTAELLLLQDA